MRYLVEPNIKEGKGGLRDLNTLFWIAQYLTPDSLLGAEALEGLLTGRERRTFDRGLRLPVGGPRITCTSPPAGPRRG